MAESKRPVILIPLVIKAQLIYLFLRLKNRIGLWDLDSNYISYLRRSVSSLLFFSHTSISEASWIWFFSPIFSIFISSVLLVEAIFSLNALVLACITQPEAWIALSEAMTSNALLAWIAHQNAYAALVLTKSIVTLLARIFLPKKWHWLQIQQST